PANSEIPKCLTPDRVPVGLTFLAIATPVTMLGQSIIGGFVRQFGSALHEHLAGAVFATVLTLTAIVACWRSREAWLRSASIGLLIVLLVQLGLGAGAWVTRFGFPPTGYVAVQHAPEQIVLRSLHTVAAMFVLLMSVQLTARVLRLRDFCRVAELVRVRTVGDPIRILTNSATNAGTLETCPTFAGGAAR
ncbi:MAG TPA: hypothetical protein VK137_21455, partial [Planctomycetaceae bacterium]|nr:hypothetical protein [Planctomycetaceae bacterium]